MPLKSIFSADPPPEPESVRITVKRAPPIPESKGKNWIENIGGSMPSWLKRVAAHIYQSEGGISKERAYGGAVNRAKKWCAGGNQKWCRVVAQWEALKAKAAAKDEQKKEPTDQELIAALFGNDPGALDKINVEKVDFSEFEKADIPENEIEAVEHFDLEEQAAPEPQAAKKAYEMRRAFKAKRTPGSLRWIEQQVRAFLNPPRNHAAPGIEQEYYFIRDVFPDRVIVEAEFAGVLLSYPYTIQNGTLVLGEPTEVMQEYVPVNQASTSNGSSNNRAQSTNTNNLTPNVTGGG